MMIRTELLIINKRGLHARAAAKLAGTASQFASSIRLGSSSQMADGKNIMSVMMLAASQGTTLQVEISGDDADAALAALTDLFARRFDEDE
ncbi:HPr family phosphocarrier protein [Venatoribacter cucullus]